MAEARDMKVKISVEEGQNLLKYAAGFGLPPKLGENTYNSAEQALAAQAAQNLYRELKSRSPMLVSDRRVCFGPAENWKKDPVAKVDNWICINPHQLVEIKLSEDAHSGAFWCLTMALHPGSPVVLAAGSQEETGWPLAKKLRLVKMLEKEIGLSTAKHRRLVLDDEPEGESSSEGQDEPEVEEVELRKV